MTCQKVGFLAGLVFLTLLPSVSLLGQANCDEGNGSLKPARPTGITPNEIIQRFAAKEAVFKQARNNYTYTRDATV